jgi:hypothetical protein
MTASAWRWIGCWGDQGVPCYHDETARAERIDRARHALRELSERLAGPRALLTRDDDQRIQTFDPQLTPPQHQLLELLGVLAGAYIHTTDPDR